MHNVKPNLLYNILNMLSPESSSEKQEDIKRLLTQNFAFRSKINPNLEKASQQDELDIETHTFLADCATSILDLSDANFDDLTEAQVSFEKCLLHLRRLEYSEDIIAKLEDQLEKVKIALNRKSMKSALIQ